MNELVDDIVLKCVQHNKHMFMATCKKYYKLFNNNSYLLFTVNTRVVFEQDHFIKRLLKCHNVRIVGTPNNIFVNWIIMKFLSILIKNGWNGLNSLSIILQPDRDGNEAIWKNYNASYIMNSLKELDLSGFRNIGLTEIADIFSCNLSLEKLKLDSRKDMYLSNDTTNMYSTHYDNILAPFLWLPINKSINLNSLKYLDISNRYLGLSCDFDDVITNISSLYNLTHLDISNNYVKNHNLNNISTMLSSCTQLTSLDMRMNIISNIDNLKDTLTQIKMLGISQSKKDIIDIKNVLLDLKDINTLYIGETNCISNILCLSMLKRIELDVDILFLIKFQNFDIHSNILQYLEYIHLNVDMWILNYEVFVLFENFLLFLAKLSSLNNIIICCDNYGYNSRKKIENILKHKNVMFLNKNPNYELVKFDDVIFSVDTDKILDENN